MIKKTISFMLAVILTIGLCACQSTSRQADGSGTGLPAENTLNTAGAEGGNDVYDEKEIGANSALKSPSDGQINSKNQLVIMDNAGRDDVRFITLDEDGKQLYAVKSRLKGYITDFALDSLDRLVVAVTETGKNSEHIQKIVVIDSTGKIVNSFETGKYKSNGSVASMEFVYDIALDKSDSIYLATSKGIRIFDKTGREKGRIGSDFYHSIDITSDGKITAVRSAGKQELVLIDPAAGDDIWAVDLSAQPGGTHTEEAIEAINVCFDNSSGSICYMDANGVTRYDMSGKPKGKVLDFSQYMILASGNTPKNLSIDRKGNFYILTASESGYEILQYDIEKGTHKEKSRKVLTLAVPTAPRWLTVAAGKFAKVNRDYRVEIKDYGQGVQNSQGGQASAMAQNAAGSGNENYVKTLNTELLTGKGPDILTVNGLSYEKYVNRNILADLNEYMTKYGGFDSNIYYMNILDALKIGGGQYALPVCVGFDLLAANKAVLDKESIKIDDSKWTWEDFARIGEKLEGPDKGKSTGTRLFPEITGSSLLESMLKGYYSRFVDVKGKKASFNSREFLDLLNMAKTYGKNDTSEMTASGTNYVEPNSVENNTVAFSMQSFTDYTGYAFLGGIYKEKLKLLRYPSVGEGKGGVFNSDSVFAINNNSKNKDAAWEFLKFLMSDEIQSGELSGFAVRKDSLKKVADRAIEMTNSGGMVYAISSNKEGSSGKPTMITPRKLTQSDIDLVNGFIANMKVYNNGNAEIQKIVADESASFLSGGKSAAEAAGIIQQKANIYLGE